MNNGNRIVNSVDVPKGARREGTMTQPAWLRGPVEGIPTLLQPIAHALIDANEDVQRFIPSLSQAQIAARPAGVASVAYHVMHSMASLDRLLTGAIDGAATCGAVRRRNRPRACPAPRDQGIRAARDAIGRAREASRQHHGTAFPRCRTYCPPRRPDRDDGQTRVSVMSCVRRCRYTDQHELPCIGH
jgi:hypothetical protein